MNYKELYDKKNSSHDIEIETEGMIDEDRKYIEGNSVLKSEVEGVIKGMKRTKPMEKMTHQWV